MKNNDPVSATIRLAIAQWPQDAPRGAVSAFCKEHELTRNTFYKILNRARSEGIDAALEPQSRRPKTSPNATSEAVKDQVVAVRKALEDSGWDHGPISVHDRMKRLGMTPPAIATLAKIFNERGLVIPAPQKKPRSAYKRFRYPQPNACWQLDATEYTLEFGTKIVVFQLEDDHSRLMIASLAARSENSEDALQVFKKGVTKYGIPQRLLTDNGDALNPIRKGVTSQLVAYANSLGVATITSRPGKPTTQGKNERVHRTLFQRLGKIEFATDLSKLQAQLDEFDHYYNNERTHQALEDRCTPYEAYISLSVASEPDLQNAVKNSTKPRQQFSARDHSQTPASMLGAEDSLPSVPAAPAPAPVPAMLASTLHAAQVGVCGERQMKMNKNNCLVIDGVMVYFTKVMRNATVWVRWDHDELLVVSVQGELVAKFSYPFTAGVKYLSLKDALAKFQNGPIGR